MQTSKRTHLSIWFETRFEVFAKSADLDDDQGVGRGRASSGLPIGGGLVVDGGRSERRRRWKEADFGRSIQAEEASREGVLGSDLKRRRRRGERWWWRWLEVLESVGKGEGSGERVSPLKSRVTGFFQRTPF